MIFNRVWAMPNSNTFSIKPINDFVQKYWKKSTVSIDPFARNYNLATYTNDLNPNTTAQYHLDAIEFLRLLEVKGVRADLIICDPPYSPRQTSECYQSIGKIVTMKDTQTAHLLKEVRDHILTLCLPGAVVLSFGWNTMGMGKKRGFEQQEILICDHGGNHNATLCLAEKLI